MKRAMKTWTGEEDRLVRLMWGEDTLRVIGQTIGRSAKAVALRAYKLGLPSRPEGYESLQRAAERSGYSAGALVKLLDGAGVKQAPPLSRGLAGRRGSSHRHYRVEDVDEVVAARLDLETVREWSARAGHVYETVRRWMVDAGHVPPSGKKRWLLPTSAMEKVVAERSRYETVRQAAARHGLHENTLGRMVKMAGISSAPWSGRVKFVLKEEVDRVVSERASVESVEAAADRHGVDVRVMTRWLLAAGLIAVDGEKKRVQKARVDTAVAAERARHESFESLAAAARRHGVHRRTMRNWLMAANVPFGGRSVLKSDADLAVRVWNSVRTRRAGVTYQAQQEASA